MPFSKPLREVILEPGPRRSRARSRYRLELRHYKRIHNLCSGGFKLGKRRFEVSNNPRIGDGRAEDLSQDTKTRASQRVGFELPGIGRKAMAFGTGSDWVFGIEPGDNVEQDRHVADIARHGTRSVAHRVVGRHASR